MRRPEGPLILLVLATFLATLIGGHVVNDALPLEGSALAAVFKGDQAPLASHAFLIMLVGGAFAWALSARKVLQVPVVRLGLPLMIFLAVLTYSVGLSAFRMASLVALTQWLGYLMSLFAVVAIAGRKAGPLWIAGAVCVGCTVLALMGVLEYVQMRQIDPTHRIFAGWVNPNATAGMLIMGLMLGLGLTGVLERAQALAAGAAAVLIGFALVLTQSKGGYLAAAVGVVVLLAWSLIFARKRFVAQLGAAAAVLAVVLVLGFALQSRSSGTPGSSGPGALARIADSGATQEQSAGFRRNLWLGAVRLMQMNPAGYGLGTYRFESARTGLNTQTRLAHNSFLELGVEATPLAPVILLAIGVLWLAELIRGARRQPVETNLLKGAILASVGACIAHSMVDSNLQYFGIGLVFFMLIGASLQLSTDSGAPEFLTRELRLMGAGTVIALCLLAAYLATASVAKGEYLAAVLRQEPDSVEQARSRMLGITPFDGEAHYLDAMTRTGQQRKEALERAVAAAPSPRHLRALAREQEAADDMSEAVESLRQVLRRDPNNLLALEKLVEVLAKAGRETESLQAAERLVAVEETPYFKVRAIPEMVPTQTFAARTLLAGRKDDAREALELLEPAVRGYLSYLETTFPAVRRFAAAEPPLDFAGESMDDALRKMEEGLDAARRLETVAVESSNQAALELARTAKQRFESVLSGGEGS